MEKYEAWILAMQTNGVYWSVFFAAPTGPIVATSAIRGISSDDQYPPEFTRREGF